MRFYKSNDVRIILPTAALTEVFDECDRFDHDETGGRVLGTFHEKEGTLTLKISGIIEPGPKARRSPVEFHQDGEHQERVFREIERTHPEVEHLGNWHTHHMNGLTHLSDGDIGTYKRTVGHPNQNTPFFYAMLIVAKLRREDPLHRYSIKHYIFRRSDDRVYEIPADCVETVDVPLVWPKKATVPAVESTADEKSFSAQPERVHDHEYVSTFFPSVRPFASKKLGVFWRGPIELVDGSTVEVVLIEGQETQKLSYSIALRGAPPELETVAEKLQKDEFGTARAALVAAERNCNRAIWAHHKRVEIESKKG